MKYKDYYQALGVPRGADEAAIKKAYRKLAREFHPDVSKAADAEARFKDIGEAYATLRDADKRAAYDALGQRRAGEEMDPPPQWQAQAGPDFQGDDIDLADLLDALGRGAHGPRHSNRPQRGRDYESTVRIRLEDAHLGATLNLDVGHGEGDRTLHVTIPAGMTAGGKLRLRGRGGPGRNGGAAGDIYLQVELVPHPVFRVDGHDLQFDLALAPWEAVLGAEIQVPTLGGPVVLTVPAGTRAGRRLRLRGRGLATRAGGHGDLYAVVRIDVPASPTDEERQLFEQLAKVSRFDPRPVAPTEPHP